MTTVYYVRHAKSDISVHDDRSRPLTPQGLLDRDRVTHLLEGVALAAVYSSPYRRAADTVQPLADIRGLPVIPVEDLRERATGSWLEDFSAYARSQWADFSYKLPGGECLAEVQSRNIQALEQILEAHPGQAVAIGGHGTALSTILRRYNPAYGYEDFARMEHRNPWVVRFSFDGAVCREIRPIDVFQPA